MEEKIKSLQYKTKANDVDEKGIVTVAVNGIGVRTHKMTYLCPAHSIKH